LRRPDHGLDRAIRRGYRVLDRPNRLLDGTDHRLCRLLRGSRGGLGVLCNRGGSLFDRLRPGRGTGLSGVERRIGPGVGGDGLGRLFLDGSGLVLHRLLLDRGRLLLQRGGLFLHRGEGPTTAGRLLEGRGLLLDRGEGSIAAASGRVLCATATPAASRRIERGCGLRGATASTATGWCLRPTPASGQILGTASASAVSATAARRIGCGLASATERILSSSFPAEEKGETQYNNQRHGESQGEARVLPHPKSPTGESSFIEAEVVLTQTPPRRSLSDVASRSGPSDSNQQQLQGTCCTRGGRARNANINKKSMVFTSTKVLAPNQSYWAR